MDKRDMGLHRLWVSLLSGVIGHWHTRMKGAAHERGFRRPVSTSSNMGTLGPASGRQINWTRVNQELDSLGKGPRNIQGEQGSLAEGSVTEMPH